MSDYFETLSTPPLLGRTFLPEENVVGNHRRAILSYALWQRQFGADSTIVGRPVTVNGFPYTVVGDDARTFSAVEHAGPEKRGGLVASRSPPTTTRLEAERHGTFALLGALRKA